MWDGFSRAARRQGMRVVRFDARQHGRSAAVADFSIERHAQDALALLDRLGIARCHVLGISMGGQAALHLALLQPARIATLVLANTSAGGNPGGAERLAQVQARIADLGYPAFAADYVASRLAGGRDSPHHARYLEDALLAGPQGYLACLRSIVAQDLHATLAQIRQPALLVAAAQDSSTPTSMMLRLQAQLPNARLVELAGAAHFSCLDAPGAFESAVLDFLSAQPS